MKRCLDFLGALIGLLLLSAFFIIVWIVIVCTTGFPGFFRQIRVGKNGADFTLYKFRTMQIKKGSEKGMFEPGNSLRFTSIGKCLRKTKLDELPQLFNVLIGDLSLVGPRPEVREWVNVFPHRWANVLKVRPGITDPASIEFINEENFLRSAPDPKEYYRLEILPKKLDLYEKYVTNHSLSTDILIIIKTLKTMVKGF